VLPVGSWVFGVRMSFGGFGLRWFGADWLVCVIGNWSVLVPLTEFVVILS